MHQFQGLVVWIPIMVMPKSKKIVYNINNQTYKALLSRVDLTFFLEVVHFFLATFLSQYVDNVFCTFMFNDSFFNLVRELVACVHPMNGLGYHKSTTSFLFGSNNILIVFMAMNLGFVKPSFENQDFILHILALDLLNFIVQ